MIEAHPYIGLALCFAGALIAVYVGCALTAISQHDHYDDGDD